MKKLLALLLFIASFARPASATYSITGATIYVSQTGSDAVNGVDTAHPTTLQHTTGFVDSSGVFYHTNPAFVTCGSRVWLMDAGGTYTYGRNFEPIYATVQKTALFGFFNTGAGCGTSLALTRDCRIDNTKTTNPGVHDADCDGLIWFAAYKADYLPSGTGSSLNTSRVVIDGSLLGNTAFDNGGTYPHRNWDTVDFPATSAYLRLFDVDIINSDATGNAAGGRILSTAPPHSCAPWSADDNSNRCDRRGTGKENHSVTSMYIHVRTINTGQGCADWQTSPGEQWSVIFLNGWDGYDRTAGQGCYLQNLGTNQKRLESLMIMGSMDNEFQISGTDASSGNNILINHLISCCGLMDASTPALVNSTFSNNHVFWTFSGTPFLWGTSYTGNSGNAITGNSLWNRYSGAIGFSAGGIESITISGNHVQGTNIYSLARSTAGPPSYDVVDLHGNTYEYAPTVGRTDAFNWPAPLSHQTFAQAKALGTTIDNTGSVYNNPSTWNTTVSGNCSPWIPTECHVVIENSPKTFTPTNSVTITAAFMNTMGIVAGDAFTFNSLQDLDNDVTTYSNWDGNDIAFNMTAGSMPSVPGVSHAKRLPIGITAATMIHPTQYQDYYVVNTFPFWGAFILDKTSTPATPTVTNLSFSPTTVAGGTSSTGTITIGSPAGGAGQAVDVTDDSSYCSETTPQTVAAGQTTKTFTLTTIGVPSQQTCTATAAIAGVGVSAAVTITAPTLSSLSCTPATVVGGSANSTCTVTISGPAPTVGTVITVSDDSAYTSEPATVTVTDGNTTAMFTATTSLPPSQQIATITNVLSGSSNVTFALTINAAAVTGTNGLPLRIR